MSGRVPAGTRAVVLAGGKGQRLLPYTTILPKPLMPVGESPILYHVLGDLAKAGFTDITISVGHLAELIMLLLGKGEKLGVKVDYAIEDMPLGTIGPLAYIRDLGENFLVMNGDVLTDLDPAALWDAHMSTGAILTIATYTREVKVDFGVLKPDAEGRIMEFVEKPTLRNDVSMGVYILNKRCLEFVPKGVHFGFDNLVLALLAAGENVRAFPHRGRWLDIGRPEDYETANREYAG